MKKMNVVKRIVAFMIMVILGVTVASENVVYAAGDVQEIEASEMVLEEEEGYGAVSVESLEVSGTEETEETGGTDEVEVTEAEGTSDCVETVSVLEILEETETDAEVWTESEETEADIEEDVKAEITSNMKSECLPYLLWYCEQMDSIVMGGTTYKDALEFRVFGDDDIRAGFNLNGIYKTISFSIGHIDGKGTGANDIVLKIYRDKVEKGSYALNNDDIPKYIICNVEGTHQLEFVFEAQGSRYNPSYFGIGNINFSKESHDTCIGKTINSNMKEKDCLPYNTKYCDLKDNIMMGGTTYKDALEFCVFGDDDIRAGFNLKELYKTVSFSVGHVDGKDANSRNIVLKIYRDGVEKGSYDLNNNDIPKSIICSVEGTRQFELVFEAQGSRYNPSYFGIGAINFSTEAIVEKPVTVTDFSIDTTKEGAVNQPLTISGSITLSEYKENLSELLQDAVNNIQWTSNDESIAKVTNCIITNIDLTSHSAVLQITVTPYKAGTVKITGKTSNNKTSSCDITIKASTSETPDVISDFSIDTIMNDGTPNGKIQAIGRLILSDGIKASREQIQEEVDNILWTSSDFQIARAVNCGQVSINGMRVQFPININCYKAGTVTITGRTLNGLAADCQVTVSGDGLDIFTIGSIDPIQNRVVEGSQVVTTARFTLNENVKVTEERIQKEINDMKWESSNKTIAEVTGCGEISINGSQVEFPIQISCYKAGSVNITGRVSTGWNRSVRITVEEKSDTGETEEKPDTGETEEKPTNVIISFNISEIEDDIKANSKIKLYGELRLREDSYIEETALQDTVDNIQWTSSDKTVAEVTDCGKAKIGGQRAEFPIQISCYKAGTARITGTIQSSKLSASCMVNVLESDSEESVYAVSFDTRNHGTAPKPYTDIPFGSKIKAPSNPQAYGYIFTGWYKDVSCKELWDFETDVVKSNIVLYAGWKASNDNMDDDDLDGVLPEDIPSGGIPDGLWIAGIKDYVYTGSPIKPQVRVYDSNKRLTAGRDYTISYKNNTKVSNAFDAKKLPAVVVKGKGNYVGTQTAAFQILKADLNDNNVIAENLIVAFNGKVQKKVPMLMYHGKKLANKKDFIVSYPNAGVNAYTALGTYDIVLTAAPQGSFTGTRTVKMTITGSMGTGNAAGISLRTAVISGITDKVYNGTVPEQDIVVMLNGKTLKEGTDYRVVYSDNIQVGTASLFITGMNAYTGTVKKSFKILPYDISQDSGNRIGGLQKTITAKYVKGGSKPKLELTFGGRRMTEGTDYTVTYKNNKAPGGGASYTIKGKGNFKGTRTGSFTIVQKPLDDICVIVPDMVYSNKAGNCISKPILTDTDGKKLATGKDYIVGSYTLEDGTTLTPLSIVGVNEKVRVEITGIGAYTGTVKAVYKITLQDFSKAKVSILNQAYTGKEITLGKNDISVRIGNAGLVYGTDYEIVEDSYVNNVKKGTAIVMIAGKGNYGGTKTVKFKITARKFLWTVFDKKTILSSGSCGEHVTYVLDSDGVLTISGSGDMDNYWSTPSPWSVYLSQIKTIVISNGVTYIGGCAFSECSNLTKAELANSVTSIGEHAFMSCSSLEGIEIPNSVSFMGPYAFAGCNGLKAVYISNLEDWCNITFDTLSNPLEFAHDLYVNGILIKELTIPRSVTSIKNHTFSGCSSLTSVKFPNSVTSIGECAFEKCSGLRKVEIPNSVTDIEAWAFMDCSSLTEVEIPNSVTNIENFVFSGCSSLTKMKIPNSVMVIGASAFSDCSGLIEVNIPNSVTNVEAWAFSNCNGLSKVEIPNSVADIGRCAFSGCSSLESIKILNTACNIYNDIQTIPNNATIYGYVGSTAQSYAEKYYTKFESLSDISYSTQEVISRSFEES